MATTSEQDWKLFLWPRASHPPGMWSLQQLAGSHLSSWRGSLIFWGERGFDRGRGQFVQLTAFWAHRNRLFFLKVGDPLPAPLGPAEGHFFGKYCRFFYYPVFEWLRTPLWKGTPDPSWLGVSWTPTPPTPGRGGGLKRSLNDYNPSEDC